MPIVDTGRGLRLPALSITELGSPHSGAEAFAATPSRSVLGHRAALSSVSMLHPTSPTVQQPVNQRWAKALRDVKEQQEFKAPTGMRGLWEGFKDAVDHMLHKAGDVYTSAQYWLQSNYPRGYILVFLLVSLLALALYVFDIATDLIVARALLETRETELVLYGWITLVFTLYHYLVIAGMLAVKFWYYLDEQLLKPIQLLRLPGEPPPVDWVGGSNPAMFGSGRLVHESGRLLYPVLSKSPVGLKPLETAAWWLLGSCLRAALQLVVILTALLLTLLSVPILDLCMMGTELWMGILTRMAESEMRDQLLGATNFLLQYQTVRVPSECFLESIPQSCFQAFLYVHLSGRIKLNSLVQSLAVSTVNTLKNLMDIYFGYKVSGFSFPAYVRNVLVFEGAAALPMQWNSLRSSRAERLVLGGDFHRLAHAQKMKLFQAALFRKRIVVTTLPERWVVEECVVVASSWSLVQFIANSLPVSLSDEKSEAHMVLHLEGMEKLQWRDDLRHTGDRAARHLQSAVWQAIDGFLNAPTIWQNLTEVMLVDAGLQECHADGLSEMVVRSRCVKLILTGNYLGDEGCAVLAGGLNLNTSIRELRLDRNHITHVGAWHLTQGLLCHSSLTHLHLGWNPLEDTGCEHVADLLQSVSTLATVSVPGVRMGPMGLWCLCHAAESHENKLRLDISSNHSALDADGLDGLLTLVTNKENVKGLNLSNCHLTTSNFQRLFSVLSSETSLRSLDLSHTYLSPVSLSAMCEMLEARHSAFLQEQRSVRTQSGLTRSSNVSRAHTMTSAAGFSDADPETAETGSMWGLSRSKGRRRSVQDVGDLSVGDGWTVPAGSDDDPGISMHSGGGGGDQQRPGAASQGRQQQRRVKGLFSRVAWKLAGLTDESARPHAPQHKHKHEQEQQQAEQGQPSARHAGGVESAGTASAVTNPNHPVSAVSPNPPETVPNQPETATNVLERSAGTHPRKVASNQVAPLPSAVMDTSTPPQPPQAPLPPPPAPPASHPDATNAAPSSQEGRNNNKRTSSHQQKGSSNHPATAKSPYLLPLRAPEIQRPTTRPLLHPPSPPRQNRNTAALPRRRHLRPAPRVPADEATGEPLLSVGVVGDEGTDQPPLLPGAVQSDDHAPPTQSESDLSDLGDQCDPCDLDAEIPVRECESDTEVSQSAAPMVEGAMAAVTDRSSAGGGAVDRGCEDTRLSASSCHSHSSHSNSRSSQSHSSHSRGSGSRASGASDTTATVVRALAAVVDFAGPCTDDGDNQQGTNQPTTNQLIATDSSPTEMDPGTEKQAEVPLPGFNDADPPPGAALPQAPYPPKDQLEVAPPVGSGAPQQVEQEAGASAVGRLKALLGVGAHFSKSGMLSAGSNLGASKGKRVSIATDSVGNVSTVSKAVSASSSTMSSLWPSLGKLRRAMVGASGRVGSGGGGGDGEVLESESAAPLPDCYIETPYLQELVLVDCGIPGGKELRRLCDALCDSPGLAILDLSGNPLGLQATEPLVDLLHAQRATLLKLTLARCRLCAASLMLHGFAAELGRVVECDLSYNPLGDAGVRRLGLAVLEAPTAPMLQVLKLNGVGMGGAGLDALLSGLALNSSLRELSCTHNVIGAVDLGRWGRLNTTNKTLRLLDLRHNQLSTNWCREMTSLATTAGTYRTLML